MWRMIHFKYKKHRILSHTIDGFDFPTSATRQHDNSLSRIPSDALRTELSSMDPKLAEATLEVGLNNPILEAGFEIICSPTSSSGDLSAIRKALQVCQVELHPFFVCGHDGKSPLTSQVKSNVMYNDLIIHEMLRKKARQHNTTRPRQLFFKEKNCLGWDSNPRPSAC